MITTGTHVRFGVKQRCYFILESRQIDTGTLSVTLRMGVSIEHGRFQEIGRVDDVVDQTLKITPHYHIHEAGSDGPAVMFDTEQPLLPQIIGFAFRFREVLTKSGYTVDDEVSDEELRQAITTVCGLMPVVYYGTS